jgi:hypothetical protein
VSAPRPHTNAAFAECDTFGSTANTACSCGLITWPAMRTFQAMIEIGGSRSSRLPMVRYGGTRVARKPISGGGSRSRMRIRRLLVGIDAGGSIRRKGSPMSMSKADYVRGEVVKGRTRHHHCHAENCDVQIPPALFMCAKHWRMVPLALQREVWRHYQPGQEKREAGVTWEYLRVTRAAIEVIAAAERRQGVLFPEERR